MPDKKLLCGMTAKGDSVVVGVCNFLLRHLTSKEYQRRLGAVLERGMAPLPSPSHHHELQDPTPERPRPFPQTIFVSERRGTTPAPPPEPPSEDLGHPETRRSWRTFWGTHEPPPQHNSPGRTPTRPPAPTRLVALGKDRGLTERAVTCARCTSCGAGIARVYDDWCAKCADSECRTKEAEDG